ncbi:arylsulfotransferase family protein [Saltatorellus ferox]
MSPGGRSHRTLHVPDHGQVEFARSLEGGRFVTLSVDEGVTLLEPDGTVVWQVAAPCHHEITVAPRPGDEPGGRLFAVALHHAYDFRGRRVRFDEVAYLEEATGRFTEDPAWPSWSTWEHREALERAVGGDPHPLSKPAAHASEASGRTEATYDYFHLNGIDFARSTAAEEEAGSGMTMVVCLRNVSLIAGVSVPGGGLEWSLGPALLDWPHAPSILAGPSGGHRLMVFDNGTHRGWSRVIEIDVDDRAILWEWRGPAGRPLWSRVRGFAERLAGGNVLVTESEEGRAYEIDVAGNVIWEFLNPEMRETETGAQRRRIYRMSGARVNPR